MQKDDNAIAFYPQEFIDKDTPLEISPAPDTLIRILMTFRGLDEYIDVVAPQIITPERKGFTVVEWGGIRRH